MRPSEADKNKTKKIKQGDEKNARNEKTESGKRRRYN